MNKLSVLLLTTILAGCTLAPDFSVPEVKIPGAYKEKLPEQTEEHKERWLQVQPMESASRGEWWTIFADEQLNALEKQAAENNPSLAAAASRVEQARATVRANASSLLPNIDIGGNAVRAQPSSAGVSAFGGNPNASLNPYTLYSSQAVASYEVDLFGRVRGNENALEADANAEAATYRSVLLSLQADVAQNYFAIRSLDSERQLLRDTIAIREEAARIMRKRFEAGESGEQDASRTESELASVKAELVALNRQRAALENAMAVLLGQMPSEFSFEEKPLEAVPPVITASLPSSLLARRPDVASAISAMQAANERIGVARTAFLPRFTLNAFGGSEASTIADLFQWSSRTWALGQIGGSALSWSIFENGRTVARVDAAKAAYEESVAGYRARVLAAFRDVEDNLTDQRLLAEQSVLLDNAATTATRTTELTKTRYGEGDVNYFEVVDAERSSLAAQRASVQTRGQRFLTTVALIRALGGGWDEPVQPSAAPAEPTE